MRWREQLVGLIAAFTMAPAAHAVEPFNMRIGYWELTWQYPGASTPTREFKCLTPEELESLRFFVSTDGDCTIQTGGTQTATRYEIDTLCKIDGGNHIIHYLLEAKEPMSLSVTVSVAVKGETQSAHGTGRWLQDSCSVEPSQVPIS
jgi:hypothetical protein